MSLYNMVKGGYNANVGTCMMMLGVEPTQMWRDMHRFRDAWFSDDGKHIIVLTRTGGNNRTEWEEANRDMRALPGYVSDKDDTSDSTFAHWTYTVPEIYQDSTAKIARIMVIAENGADEQGPAAMMRNLEAVSGMGASKLKPKPSQDEIKSHPDFEPGWRAHLDLMGALLLERETRMEKKQ